MCRAAAYRPYRIAKFRNREQSDVIAQALSTQVLDLTISSCTVSNRWLRDTQPGVLCNCFSSATPMQFLHRNNRQVKRVSTPELLIFTAKSVTTDMTTGRNQPLTEYWRTDFMRTALFCVTAQRVVVIIYRRFGTNLSVPSSRVKNPKIHYSLHNNTAQRNSQLLHGGSPK